MPDMIAEIINRRASSLPLPPIRLPTVPAEFTGKARDFRRRVQITDKQAAAAGFCGCVAAVSRTQ